MNKWLNFGGNPDDHLDTEIVFRIRHYWEIRTLQCRAYTSKHCHSNYDVIRPPAHDRQRDWNRNTGKTCLGRGMHCPSASSCGCSHWVIKQFIDVSVRWVFTTKMTTGGQCWCCYRVILPTDITKCDGMLLKCTRHMNTVRALTDSTALYSEAAHVRRYLCRLTMSFAWTTNSAAVLHGASNCQTHIRLRHLQLINHTSFWFTAKWPLFS